ncbi:DNA-binding response regulator [Paenibacillus baekrokdamisoli]|uniref:DNA-binding response regulator n=1 Tax=Paenibacillus baekrokdamisoli TaxID=1712516 RepID=A0A3G9JE53_9BACL|nr:LytTR family DNA-binding domain-containing protein [Paenibacillus baekrokdamisoli]MBB3072383.1 DNA-binding LytR/AlgR family response regulator [Paenibacillus baekrokdamisoli]BBH23253.1 DNA-binding response regulator [Paenibacillus baekrokdamisoli]
MTYHIAICDDEQIEVKYLSMLVNKWAAANGRIAVMDTFESAEAFLFRYAENKSFDILLLDIEMGGMNGVELAQHIRHDNESVQIVFITGFPDFIAQGYEVSALHYLMKPVSEVKLFAVLDKASKNLNKIERAIMLNIGGESVRIPVSSIICVEAAAHSVLITTTADPYDAKQSISEILNMLGDSFIRCHRSYIVGLKYIKRITKTDVILDNGMAIPLSRRSYDEVNQAFIKFFKVE